MDILVTVIGPLALGVLATWYFAKLYYGRSSEDLKRQVSDLKIFITRQLDYQNKLLEKLEARGEASISRDDAGLPTNVQILRVEGIPSEEAFGEPTIPLGPPPSPPEPVVRFVRLREKILQDLIERWQEGQRTMDSEDVYKRLIESGEEVPEGIMNEVLDDLKRRGFIRGPGYHDREGIKQHGARTVTWVDRDADHIGDLQGS